MALRRFLAVSVLASFVVNSLGPLPQAHADAILNLPAPGTMVTPTSAYEPVMIKGLKVHPNNPFLFDFIVDTGTDHTHGQALKETGEKLARYFLASLAIPDQDLWVNLSPYEKNKIIPKDLGQTGMGRDLLAEDYILKQLTASSIYPEKHLGKEFWDRVYAKARKMYGTTDIPVNTFNKVWITADKAEVFERNDTVFVLDRHLKVMLDQDYLALQKHNSALPTRGHLQKKASPSRLPSNEALNVKALQGNTLASQIIRKIILPEIEREVNTGKNFAALRQAFNAIILASWYKKHLKQALLNQVYSNKSIVKGIVIPAKAGTLMPHQIYQQYLRAYKKGVFNFIKEESDPVTHQVIPRKYFSGGVVPGAATDAAVIANPTVDQLDAAMRPTGNWAQISVVDKAMLTETAAPSRDADTLKAQIRPVHENVINPSKSELGPNILIINGSVERVVRLIAYPQPQIAGKVAIGLSVQAVSPSNPGWVMTYGYIEVPTKLWKSIRSYLPQDEEFKEYLKNLDWTAVHANVIAQKLKEAADRGIDTRHITPDAAMINSETFYTKLKLDQIPKGLGSNFSRYGLTLEGFKLAEVGRKGRLVKPQFKVSPLKNMATKVGVSVAMLQALAAASYAGTLKGPLGRQYSEPGDFGKEIDGSAVQVGVDSLEELAELFNIGIIVGGNEGALRDKSSAMPVGRVFNPKAISKIINAKGAQNGIFMYFGDSVEVTNGVKLELGRPGSSSMVTLVPLMMPSTDGYRISLAVDKFNPKQPFPDIDPVITSKNTLRDVLGQIAAYMDIKGKQKVEAFIRQMAQEYKFVTLDRRKHDELIAQAKKLRFKVSTREDGDPLLFIRAMLGIPDEDGKKLFVISTGGANEHLMSMIFAVLYGNAMMYSTNAALQALKAVDKQPKPQNLKQARSFSPSDVESFQKVNEALGSLRQMRLNIPKAPETLEALSGDILNSKSKELVDVLKKGGASGSLAVASITGANPLDWGVLQPHMQPVTWLENKDGSGNAIINGFFINNSGKTYFFRASFKTKNVLGSRFAILALNQFSPNPLIKEYEKTEKSYREAIHGQLIGSKGEIDIRAHVESIERLLGADADAKGVLDNLINAFNAFEVSSNKKNRDKIIAAVRGTRRYILGDPKVEMPDGTIHHVVLRDAAMVVKENVPGRQTKSTIQNGVKTEHYTLGHVLLRGPWNVSLHERDSLTKLGEKQSYIVVNGPDGFYGTYNLLHQPNKTLLPSIADKLFTSMPDGKEKIPGSIGAIVRSYDTAMRSVDRDNRLEALDALINDLKGRVKSVENDLDGIKLDQFEMLTRKDPDQKVLLWKFKLYLEQQGLTVNISLRPGDERTGEGKGLYLYWSRDAHYDVNLIRSISRKWRPIALNGYSMVAVGRAQISTPGGIDLNTSNMRWQDRKEGQGVQINFDPALVAQIRAHGLQSLTPIVYKVTPIANIWPEIGLNPPQKQQLTAGV